MNLVPIPDGYCCEIGEYLHLSTGCPVCLAWMVNLYEGLRPEVQYEPE